MLLVTENGGAEAELESVKYHTMPVQHKGDLFKNA